MGSFTVHQYFAQKCFCMYVAAFQAMSRSSKPLPSPYKPHPLPLSRTPCRVKRKNMSKTHNTCGVRHVRQVVVVFLHKLSLVNHLYCVIPWSGPESRHNFILLPFICDWLFPADSCRAQRYQQCLHPSLINCIIPWMHTSECCFSAHPVMALCQSLTGPLPSPHQAGPSVEWRQCRRPCRWMISVYDCKLLISGCFENNDGFSRVIIFSFLVWSKNNSKPKGHDTRAESVQQVAEL